MSGPPAVLGLDLGTSQAKALLCADGTVLGRGVAGYQVSTPRGAVLLAARAAGLVAEAVPPDRSDHVLALVEPTGSGPAERAYGGFLVSRA